jgi:hypothetical protein
MENKETLVRDYSNRSCQTCNLFNTNNSAEKACELKLENKCASYANDETLGDFWISCLDDESDSVLYKQETFDLKRNNMKQTAVEWLFEKLWETPKDKFNWYLIFGQAKQMEKEQIIDAYDKGEFNQGCNEDAEQYYNETFKSE